MSTRRSAASPDVRPGTRRHVPVAAGLLAVAMLLVLISLGGAGPVSSQETTTTTEPPPTTTEPPPTTTEPPPTTTEPPPTTTEPPPPTTTSPPVTRPTTTTTSPSTTSTTSSSTSSTTSSSTSSTTTSSTTTTTIQPVQIVPPANPGAGGDDPGSDGSGDGGGWSTDMRLGIVVGGLVGVAALVGAITFFYWRRTRPQPYLTALDALAEIDRGGLDGPRPANGVAGANGLLHTPPRGTTTADVLAGGAVGAAGAAAPAGPSTGIVGPAPLTPRPPLGPPASVRVIGGEGATGTGQPNPAGSAAAPAPGPLRLPPVGAEPTSAPVAPAAPAAPAAPKLKLPEPGEVRPLIDPPTAPLVTLEDLQSGSTPPADDA